MAELDQTGGTEGTDSGSTGTGAGGAGGGWVCGGVGVGGWLGLGCFNSEEKTEVQMPECDHESMTMRVDSAERSRGGYLMYS